MQPGLHAPLGLGRGALGSASPAGRWSPRAREPPGTCCGDLGRKSHLLKLMHIARAPPPLTAFTGLAGFMFPALCDPFEGSSPPPFGQPLYYPYFLKGRKTASEQNASTACPLCPGWLVPFAQLPLSSPRGPVQAPPVTPTPHPSGCAAAPGHLLLSDTSEQEGNSSPPASLGAHLGQPERLHLKCNQSGWPVPPPSPPPPCCIRVADGSLHYAPPRVVGVGGPGPRAGPERLWALEPVWLSQGHGRGGGSTQRLRVLADRAAPALHLSGAAAGKIFQIS